MKEPKKKLKKKERYCLGKCQTFTIHTEEDVIDQGDEMLEVECAVCKSNRLVIV